MKADRRPRRAGQGSAVLSLVRARPDPGRREGPRARRLALACQAPRPQERSVDGEREWRAPTSEGPHGRPVRHILRRRDASCLTCELRRAPPGAGSLASKHTAGKVRGHASLMRPTKPSPGVPFVALPLYHGPNAHHDTIAALSAEVESLNLPSAWLANVIAARGDLAMLLRSVSPVKPDHPRAGSRRRSNCTVFRARFLMRRSHCVVRSGSK